MQLDSGQLIAFKATVERGTLDAAARELHVTPSAVSQRLKALETAVGRVLLERTKPVTMTKSGEAVLRLARQIEALADETARQLDGAEGLPCIPLAINADSLTHWMMPALAEAAEHMSLEVFRENEEHTISFLREGRVMAAVTSAAKPVQGCTASRLGSMQYRPMASAEFAERWFEGGVDADAFALAPMVMFDRRDELQDRYLHRRWRRNIDPPRNYIPSSWDYTQGVLHGLGWGLIPFDQAEELEASGELIDLDPGEHQDTRLYWQQWKLSSAPLDLLADAVRRAARQSLFP